MSRLILLTVVCLCASAQADIVIHVPDATIPNSTPTSTLTVAVTLSGSYDVAGFGILMQIVGRDGATGVTFTGVAEAPNYLFTLPIGSSGRYGFETTTSFPSLSIYGDDAVRLSVGSETIADTTRNLITVDLAIAPGTLGIFDITLAPVFTALNDTNGISFEAQVLDSGVLTVVSEPLTLLLFAPALPMLLSRLRRRRSPLGARRVA